MLLWLANIDFAGGSGEVTEIDLITNNINVPKTNLTFYQQVT